jgi:type VII secretion integral membrane protein EccD
MADALTRITVSGPVRRADLAVPGDVPVAEFLPELLRHSGDGLADDGERHGGWVLRRSDGVPVSAVDPLLRQGIRDGEVLHLVPGQTDWPEPEYDDAVEVVAAATRGRGTAWPPLATRRYANTAAAAGLGAGWLILLSTGGPESAMTAGALAAALAIGAVLPGRVWRNEPAGAVLAGAVLAYSFATGVLVAGDGTPTGPLAKEWPTAVALLTGLVSMSGAGLLAVVVLTAGRPVAIAGVTVGISGSLAATTAQLGAGAAGTAAGVLVAVGCGAGLLPRLATRVGHVPVPGPDPVTVDPVDRPLTDVHRVDRSAGDVDRVGRSAGDVNRLLRGVTRAEQMLTGMLIGCAVLVAAGSVVLVQTGGMAGQILVGMTALAVLLRSRVFTSVRQRLPLLVAGLAMALLLVLGGIPAHLPVPVQMLVPCLGALALVIVAGSGRYAGAGTSPQLSRAADVLDTVAVVSLIPLAGAVLGLYEWATGLLI